MFVPAIMILPLASRGGLRVGGGALHAGTNTPGLRVFWSSKGEDPDDSVYITEKEADAAENATFTNRDLIDFPCQREILV
jgi:hypothetical protein